MPSRQARVPLLALLAAASVLALDSRPADARPAPEEDWRTPAEIGGYSTTPRYAETMDYLRRLASAAPRRLRIEKFGETGEGRDLVVAIASRDGVFDPAVIHRAGRPVVLIQNAIHAGEMDGKDACLALLRDAVVTKEQAALLEKAVLVTIPIYNADGHERFGPFNRINQNGPAEMGWRTQASNLNLNRDYMKADAPETRAFFRLWNRWLPDFFVDTHSTDGADFVYDVTYYVETGPQVRPDLDEWQRRVLIPHVERSVAASGHEIAPFIALQDDTDPAQGLVIWPSTPRFSTGYASLHNRPAFLVEMHMLKDYRMRVTGTYETLRAILEVVNREAGFLVASNRRADAETTSAGARADPGSRFPLRMEVGEETDPFLFRGYRYRRSLSEVSGGVRIEYTGQPLAIEVPRSREVRVAGSVTPPRAYIVPAPWRAVIDLLEAHGLVVRRTTRPWTGTVETYRCEGARWLERPYEGRQVLFGPGEARPGESAPSPGTCRTTREEISFPAGSAVVPLDQRAAAVAIHLLEPEGPDSAMAWGFFNAIFERKEYAEAYVMEEIARKMLAEQPELREEFERKVASDPGFAASPAARLDFFYRRSPWWDQRLGLVPVGRLSSLEGLPLAPPR
jgi:hypothetical protein